MNQGKANTSSRNKLFKFILLSAILTVVFLLIAVFFLKSPYFPRLVEKIINSRIEKHIELGSIVLAKGHGIVIRDVIIRENDKGEPFITLPQVEMGISLSSILSRSIDKIDISKPKLFFDLKKKSVKPAGSKIRFSRPFSVKKLSIEDGEVIMQVEKDKLIRVSSINLSLDKTGDKKAEMKGSVFLNEFNITVPVEAVLDMDRFDIEKGHFALELRELEKLSVKDLTFLKDKKIQGSLSLSVDIYREDRLRIQVNGDFQNLMLTGNDKLPLLENVSGGLLARFMISEDYHIVDLVSEITVSSLLYHAKTFEVNFKNKDLKLAAKSVYNLKEDDVNIEFLQVQLAHSQLLNLQGSLQKVSSGDPEMNLRVEGKEIALNKIKELFTGTAAKSLSNLDIDGYGSGDFYITGNLKSPRIKGDIYVNCKGLKKENSEFRAVEMTIPLEYQANSLVIRQALIKIKDAIDSGEGEKKGFSHRVNDIEFVIPSLEYKDSMLQSENVYVKATQAVVYRNGKEFHREEKISLKSVIKGNLDRRVLWVQDISLKTASVEGIAGDISLHIGKPATIQAEVMYSGIDIEKVWTGFPDIFPEKLFTVKGTGGLHSVFTVTISEGADVDVVGKADLSITKGSFSSPDAANVGEGINTNVSSSFKLSLPLRATEFTINAEAADFELLIGRFYGSFKDKKISLFLEGKYAGANDSIHISRSKLSLTDIGTINISGEILNLISEPHFNAEVNLIQLSNNKAYDFFIRETFKENLPILSQLEIGGATSMKLSVKGTVNRFNVSGELNIVDMDVVGKSRGLSIQGIYISMPLDVWYPEVVLSEDIERLGSLKVQDISWEDLHFKDLEAFPAIWGNAVVFKEDILIPIFGGNIKLKNIIYKDIFNPQRKLTMSIDINGIDLDEVSEALKISRFSGSLSGVIPEASLVGSRLITEGEIVMALFGGEMRVSNLSINNIFSSISSLKASIGIKGIDLGKLTNTFEFGHISGIMQGYINNLVITKGQAESFDALIETVDRKGVRQWISVEALRKISILGSGSPASILNTGIYQFFKKYRYKKMGFKGSLRNDTFHLLGVEAEGNRQYLVRGGLLPPRVDVINYTQDVSFQEMIKRLNRIKLVEKEKK